ncbi:protein of unknown function (DUF1844) [Candidatus Kryptobacter tengchongensis]|nr:protein of unknown function (DUF1844) [Candidatus Kryptobacter tengchongensis]
MLPKNTTSLSTTEIFYAPSNGIPKELNLILSFSFFKIYQSFNHNKFQEAMKSMSLFEQLVFILYTQGWEQLGKIPNPITGKIEKKLEEAKFTIDLLDMLKEKTKGNLTEDEIRFLEYSISQLKINYFFEVENERKQKSETTPQNQS